jgi:hypothetical protein
MNEDDVVSIDSRWPLSTVSEEGGGAGHRSLMALAGCILLTVALAAPAHALSPQAWVSRDGSDRAGCGSVEKPCRTLQYVHDNVIAEGGEIYIRDPAGYGAVTITKGVSIVNDGVGAAVVHQPGQKQSAITIDVGVHGAVHLRGLTLDGQGGNVVSMYGIQVKSAATVTVVNCVVRNFGTGIAIFSDGDKMFVSVSNSIVSDNGSDGIDFNAAFANGPITGIVNQTTVSYNGANGIDLISGSGGGGNVAVTVVDSVAFHNGSGFAVDGAAATMWIGPFYGERQRHRHLDRRRQHVPAWRHRVQLRR